MHQVLNSPPRLIKEAEAAEMINFKVTTLRRWRWAGKELGYLKIGGAVRYDPVELQAYIEARRRNSTSGASFQAN